MGLTDSGGPFTPPEPRGWWRNRRMLRLTVLLTAVAVLVAGAVWGVTAVVRSCGSLGSGVDEVDGECVGVTDGSYVFQPELADVQQRIAAENARVRAESSSYVTVALLDPLTPGSRNVLPSGAVRQRLEGAYTALRRVNSTPVVGDPRPQVQLVLASEGSTEGQRRHVIGRLVQMREREHPLVAVIGLGVSTAQTQHRAEELSRHGIPMVSAYLTADMLNYENIPGLIRMAPSNRHYVEALRGYVDSTDLGSAIMVRDSNSERGEDLFTQTLADNFERQLGDLIDFAPQQFTGMAIPTDADPLLFSHVRANICAAAAAGLQFVLYAGREVDLGSFLEALEHRSCERTPLTILTAGLDLGEILEGRDLDAANLTIVVAGTVDPEGWEQNVAGTPDHYIDFLSEYRRHGFDSRQLDGANAIMMHDALLAATQAVRLAAPGGAASSPTADGVRAQLLNLNGEYEVPGASGTLSISAASPGAANPVGKPVPVLQYPRPSDGSFRQVGPLYRVTN